MIIDPDCDSSSYSTRSLDNVASLRNPAALNKVFVDYMDTATIPSSTIVPVDVKTAT